MSSLRARVMVGVVALSAIGMIALAAVTYTEQRSFLLGRVDQEVKAAVPYMSQLLDAKLAQEENPTGSGPGLFAGEANGTAQGPQGSNAARAGQGGQGDEQRERGFNAPPGFNPPPGTFGQRRTAAGKVRFHETFNYGQTAGAEPALPAKVPLNRIFTVDAKGSSTAAYRAYAQRDPEDSGVTVVAVPLGEVTDTLHRLLLVEGLVIAGVIVALGLSAWFVVKVGLRPLTRMEVTAEEIAAGDLSRRVTPSDGRTEVGRLGLALNAMLDRLEQAFAARKSSEERLRQFLADASHELRTPLASIRGYAELFRMGATSSPEEVDTSMRRIEQESKRMGVLVEDLLTLARLDEEPERDWTQVDLSRLADDAVKDARARAPERRIELEASEPALVLGDAHGLRQVLTNLLGNAVVHTPPGTPVDVAVTTADGTVRLDVRDHGQGIPPRERELLFERFWRREAGRERGKAGAGLGLAIVQGIVTAHRGQIAVENDPDGGARFTVTLPAAPSGQHV